MRAVNLIPADARAGGGASAGRSGGAVYALLGGLAALVLLAVLWASASGTASDRRAELASVQAEVAQIRARATALQAPGAVQQERLTATAMVRQLVEGRTNWAARLDAITRTLPADITLGNLDAQGAGAAVTAAPAATGEPAPAGAVVKLVGCAPSQRAVAKLMPRLRSVPEVTGVTLVSSAIGGAGEAGAGGTADAGCTGAAFTMNMTFEAAAPAAAAAAAPADPSQGAQAPGAATTAVEGTPDPGTGGTQ